ncbi:MAG TPA: YbhB/YbcL family Raf kinase inhibitor-like protein, partial [Polyangia bacterium]|nr:YbhB/YbcL family Raf kinase inhibitor-like protein [Polyangia bacterium]
QELVVLCEDPDAPKPQPFVHWIVTGVPPDTTELLEGLPPSPTPLSSGAAQGRNDMGKHGYYGPEPPPGHGVHHYHFQVFAVDRALDVRTPADRDALVQALRGHVVGWGELVGTYER